MEMALSDMKLLKKICKKERSLELPYMKMDLYGMINPSTVCKYYLAVIVAHQSLMLLKLWLLPIRDGW